MEVITNTLINKKYENKPQQKALQIKMQVPNLYLFVTKRGVCSFKFRCYIDGMPTWVTFGRYPIIDVPKALNLAYEAQIMRDNGVNPNHEKKEKARKSIKFKDFIENYITTINKINNFAESTIKYNNYLFKVATEKLGGYKVNEITGQIIYSKLIKSYFDDDKLAMANRFRVKLQQVFDYAVKQEIIEKNPVLLLDAYYKPKDAQERNLYLTESELKEFINTLYDDEYLPNLIKYYVHLIIILGVRKSELQHATWDMIDFDNAVFNNYQIKTKKINKIPLSNQAIKLLQRIKSVNTSNYVVVNNNTISKNKPVGHNYFNRILDNLAFNANRDPIHQVSPHDFRRALSTLANESELFAPIDIEMALGHETRSGTEKHYNNTTAYLNRKRAVFEWMANKVDSLIDNKNIYDLWLFL